MLYIFAESDDKFLKTNELQSVNMGNEEAVIAEVTKGA